MKMKFFCFVMMAGLLLGACSSDKEDLEPEEDDPVLPSNGIGYTVNGVTFYMVDVKGGTFTMGKTSGQQEPPYNAKPAHEVTLSDFAIGETEVTQELWVAVMGTNPSFEIADLQRPVENVSYYDCLYFIRKLNKVTGEHFALPTEAQWEYAARGGVLSKGYQYSGSDNVEDVARCYVFDPIGGTPVSFPVKSLQPNELGLYDMSGNVYEWCLDWYGAYPSSAQIDPIGPSTGDYRVCRGGSCASEAVVCSVISRTPWSPQYGRVNVGFRLALSTSN